MLDRSFWILPLAALIVVPSAADAQRARRASYDNSFSFEPYAGVYNDAFDLSDSQAGLLVGLRIGYDVASRIRLLANLGYAKAEDVAFAPGPDLPTYDNVWVLTTAGAEFDIIPGGTGASIGIEGGVAWRKTELEEEGPIPAPGEDLSSDSFASYEVLVPGVTVRHGLGSRVALRLSLQDYMFDVFDGPVDHSLALTLGIAFR